MSADVSEAVARLSAMARALRRYGKGFGYGDVEVALLDAEALDAAIAALQEGSGALPASPSGGQGSSPAAIPTEPLEPLLAELERLALAATPGEWSSQCFQVSAGREAIAHTGFGQRGPAKSGQCEKDASFIAAANPATVLKLIAAVRAGSMGILRQQNEPQPSPEPRDREEG